MTTASETDLERRATALLESLSRDEVAAPATSASHQLGRLVVVGTCLGDLLRAAVVYVAEVEGCRPEDLVAPTAGRPTSFRKSMTGPLAYGLKGFFEGRSAASVPAKVAPLVADLLRPSSTILRCIAIRNDVAKDGGDPVGAKPVLAEMKKLVVDYRRRNGWK